MSPSLPPSSSPLTRLGLACIALLCVMPFLQPWHRYPLTGFYSEWLAFALGLGAMAPLLERRSWREAGIPWLAVAPFALAFLLVAHGALGWSPYFGQALTGALYLVWAGALVIAARTLAHACGPATVYAVLAAGLAAGGLLSALVGVIQHFNLITPLNAFIARPGGAAIFGNLGQANHFAMHATLGLLSLTYLYALGRVPLAAGVVAVVPMLFVLGLSGSRSVLLYLVAAFALAAWLRTGDADRSARRLFMATGAFIAAYYAMQLLVDAGWFRVVNRDSITAVERLFSGAASVTERLSLWRAAWAMTLEHPLTGVGWGGYSAQYFEFITAMDASGLYSLYHHAHNIVLQLLAETGVPGALLVIVPSLVWLLNVHAGVRGAAQWWLLALAAVLGLHSLLEFPLWYAYFLGPAALLLGVAPVRVFRPRLERIGPMLAAALIGMGAFNLATLWLDYRDFERVFRPFDCVVAADAADGIGKDNDLPWPRLKGDLRFFRELTSKAAPPDGSIARFKITHPDGTASAPGNRRAGCAAAGLCRSVPPARRTPPGGRQRRSRPGRISRCRPRCCAVGPTPPAAPPGAGR